MNYDNLNAFFYSGLILYLPVVFTLKHFVDKLSINSKKYLSDILKYPWVFWCLSLSIFSTLGTYYLGKYFLFNKGENILDTEYAIWYHLFIISKLPELFDTIFIVLRSKPLVMLQYYHHWATLAIAFYFTRFQCSEATPFMFMNYFVHMFMYFYFAMYQFIPKIMKKFGTFVNIIQTLQMLIATYILLDIWYYTRELNCLYEMNKREFYNIFIYATVMYISYFILFINLFMERSERIKKN